MFKQLKTDRCKVDVGMAATFCSLSTIVRVRRSDFDIIQMPLMLICVDIKNTAAIGKGILFPCLERMLACIHFNYLIQSRLTGGCWWYHLVLEHLYQVQDSVSKVCDWGIGFVSRQLDSLCC